MNKIKQGDDRGLPGLRRKLANAEALPAKQAWIGEDKEWRDVVVLELLIQHAAEGVRPSNAEVKKATASLKRLRKLAGLHRMEEV